MISRDHRKFNVFDGEFEIFSGVCFSGAGRIVVVHSSDCKCLARGHDFIVTEGVDDFYRLLVQLASCDIVSWGCARCDQLHRN